MHAMQDRFQAALAFLTPIVFMEPERVASSPAWLGHSPFAFWIVDNLRPRVLAELGTYVGTSLACFLQAVKTCGLPTLCYGIGAWEDDQHEGTDGDSVFQDLTSYLEARYAEHFHLVRRTSDHAMADLADVAIDVLHIAGTESYDAVRHDFETWLPRLSDCGVVLLHGTNVRYSDCGVWRLWGELSEIYPSVNFPHSDGLGVLAVGRNIPPRLAALLDATAGDLVCAAAVRELFGRLGGHVTDTVARLAISAALQGCRQEMHKLDREVERLRNELDAHHITVIASLAEVERLRAASQAVEERLRKALTVSEQERRQLLWDYEAMSRSTSWRVTAPLRYMLGAATRGGTSHRRRDGLALTRGSADVADASETEDRPDPRALFDEKWYRSKYPDTNDWDDVFRHYMELGAAEGRDPSPLFSTTWYLQQYPDVALAKLNPLVHFAECGWRERRSPHRLFDSNWYLSTYEDAAVSGQNPLLHYIRYGAVNCRNPNRSFDSRYYVNEHPEAAENPLRHYILVGESAGWPTRKHCYIRDYLPYTASLVTRPSGISVDLVIPVYRGLAETQACLASVLADDQRPAGRILVIDDCSPEPRLSAWLQELASGGGIVLMRNPVNRGFVGTVNRGMMAAGRHDVVLLNSDTEVPRGWLARLMAQAYMEPRIASVTPYSNNATICSYPSLQGGPLPSGHTFTDIDQACQTANGSRSVAIPSAVGFCMYIRRECLDEVGCFDEEAFGRGYGEENDFCMRAATLGWHHVLACNVFVYHAGEVSFGAESPERVIASEVLRNRHPSFPAIVARFVDKDPALPFRFAVTVALFAASSRPNLLFIASNGSGGGIEGRLDDLVRHLEGRANVLLLRLGLQGTELTVPALRDHPVLEMDWDQGMLLRVLCACALDRIHIGHIREMDASFLRAVVETLALPFDLTLYDCYPLCPQTDAASGVPVPECGAADQDLHKRSAAVCGGDDAHDSWEPRATHAWLLERAARIFCANDSEALLAADAPVLEAPICSLDAYLKPVSKASLPPGPCVEGLALSRRADRVGLSRAIENAAPRQGS